MKNELLRNLPSVDAILRDESAGPQLEPYPRTMAVYCIRQTLDELRTNILNDQAGRCGAMHVSIQAVTASVVEKLREMTRPSIRRAINATGIILHTGLGRAVWPAAVVDSVLDDLKGYVTLAIDCETGKRSDRDNRVEYILQELTGAEAATVVNNNAAASILVLAALGCGREVIVSRGQLIEIGGSFRLPDVMAQSGAKMVEVGTTNRTHLRDYENALTEDTAVIMRAHPSNFRVVGFTSEVPLADMVELAHSRDLIMVDDLGAGALVDFSQFSLPKEPMVAESIQAGADVVFFSADKLIGASQGGIIVGKKEYIDRIRKHPLARAMRPDKSCLMILERTLHLFREPEKLVETHPTYRMLAAPMDVLQNRGEKLLAAIQNETSKIKVERVEGVAYLGSGSLPMEQLKSWAVAISLPDVPASELARRLRLDDACIFTRIENDRVLLDMRTVTDKQVPQIAAAVARVIA